MSETELRSGKTCASLLQKHHGIVPIRCTVTWDRYNFLTAIFSDKVGVDNGIICNDIRQHSTLSGRENLSKIGNIIFICICVCICVYMSGFYPSTFLGPVTGPRNSIWDWVLILNLELQINYLCIHDTIKRDFCDFQIFTLSKYSSVVINTVLYLTLKYEQCPCPHTPPPTPTYC